MDNYRFEKVGTRSGHPVYLVRNVDGECIGVIERCRASTDTQISGTRLRRPGKGRNEWRPACGSPRGSDEREAITPEPYREQPTP